MQQYQQKLGEGHFLYTLKAHVLDANVGTRYVSVCHINHVISELWSKKYLPGEISGPKILRTQLRDAHLKFMVPGQRLSSTASA